MLWYPFYFYLQNRNNPWAQRGVVWTSQVHRHRLDHKTWVVEGYVHLWEHCYDVFFFIYECMTMIWSKLFQSMVIFSAARNTVVPQTFLTKDNIMFFSSELRNASVLKCNICNYLWWYRRLTYLHVYIHTCVCVCVVLLCIYIYIYSSSSSPLGP